MSFSQFRRKGLVTVSSPVVGPSVFGIRDQVQPLLHDGHFGSCPSLNNDKSKRSRGALSGLPQCYSRAIYVALVPSWGQTDMDSISVYP